MPHFGLIEEGLTAHDELVMRAKLHVRGGRKRLERGNIADAIAALYDAFVSAVQARAIKTGITKNTSTGYEIDNEEQLFDRLVGRGLFSEFDREEFDYFGELLEGAFRGDVERPPNEFLDKVYQALRELSILPIEESELPDGEAVTL